jgi:aerobic-type carbon monoxide dehydrogenase small subunit (CoxS/CutS family)
MTDADPATTHTANITLEVNGRVHRLTVRHQWSLLDVLREQLDLTGAKRGCDRGECGACTVLLAGRAVYSCQVLALQVGPRPVVTVEGLAAPDAGSLDPVQQAFLDNDGAQCGYCTPGFVMAVRALLDDNPQPSDDDIRQALAGNLCRCNAYGRILQSVRAIGAGNLCGPCEPPPVDTSSREG